MITLCVSICLALALVYIVTPFSKDLPFKNFVERVNGKLYLRQEETGYPQGDGSKPLVVSCPYDIHNSSITYIFDEKVQFAATMPNEGAAWYRSSGAVYTQASN